MLFIGIEAGKRTLVLNIETPGDLGGGEVPGSRIGSEDERGGNRGIGERVVAHLGRDVERLKRRASGHHLLEPPDLKGVVTRNRVDRDDGPLGGRIHAHTERVTIGGRQVPCAARNIAAHFVAGGSVDARADRRRDVDRTQAVALLKPRPGRVLGVQPDIPHFVGGRELQQRAAQAVPRTGDQQALGGGVDRGFGLREVVLEDDLRDLASGEAHSGRRRAAAGGSGIVGKTGEVGRPNLQVVALDLWPENPELRLGRRGEKVNGGVVLLEPVERDALGVQVLAFGIINPLGIFPRYRPVVGLGIARRRLDWRGDPFGGKVQGEQLVVFVPGRELLPEDDGGGDRFGDADDIDNVGAQELMHAASVRLERSEVLDQNAPFEIVGMELADAGDLIEPEGASLGGERGAFHHGCGDADRLILLGDGGGKIRTIHGIDRLDFATGHGDRRAGEAALRPEYFPDGQGAAAGDRENLLLVAIEQC